MAKAKKRSAALRSVIAAIARRQVPASRSRGARKPATVKVPSSLERTFETLWRMHGKMITMRHDWLAWWIPEREYVFHETRKWRLDFAWPEQKVAVELEGGIYTKGGHTSVTGFIRDCDKYNALSAAGWRLFRFTEKHLATQPVQCCELVATALASPRGAGESHA